MVRHVLSLIHILQQNRVIAVILAQAAELYKGGGVIQVITRVAECLKMRAKKIIILKNGNYYMKWWRVGGDYKRPIQSWQMRKRANCVEETMAVVVDVKQLHRGIMHNAHALALIRARVEVPCLALFATGRIHMELPSLAPVPIPALQVEPYQGHLV